MGPEGHFETCTLVAAIAQSEAADAVIAAALPPATEADMLERVKAINRTAEPTVLAAQADTIAKLRELLAEALPIVAYVSTGRSYVDVELYPDSTARIVNYKIREALGEYTAAALEDADARA